MTEGKEKTARLSRAFFSTSMPDDFKRVFIQVVQHTHFLPEAQRTFLLKLFVMTPPENNVSG